MMSELVNLVLVVLDVDLFGFNLLLIFLIKDANSNQVAHILSVDQVSYVLRELLDEGVLERVQHSQVLLSISFIDLGGI